MMPRTQVKLGTVKPGCRVFVSEDNETAAFIRSTTPLEDTMWDEDDEVWIETATDPRLLITVYCKHVDPSVRFNGDAINIVNPTSMLFKIFKMTPYPEPKKKVDNLLIYGTVWLQNLEEKRFLILDAGAARDVYLSDLMPYTQ